MNDEEEKLYPDKEINPEEITPEELEEFSKRLSKKLNKGLEMRGKRAEYPEKGFSDKSNGIWASSDFCLEA